MLSKASLLILGLISQKDINPYELIKTLDLLQIKNWFNIANSTVYSTIKNLNKSKLVQGNAAKEGNMPEKTIYSITSTGNEILRENIKKILITFSYETILFSIASLFLNIFEREDLDGMLGMRLELLIKFKNGIEKQLNYLELSGVVPLIICNVRRNSNLINCEIETTKEYIDVCKNMNFSKDIFNNILFKNKE